MQHEHLYCNSCAPSVGAPKLRSYEAVRLSAPNVGSRKHVGRTRTRGIHNKGQGSTETPARARRGPLDRGPPAPAHASGKAEITARDFHRDLALP